MVEAIDFELLALEQANLSNLKPNYLFNYFKDDLNDRILVNLTNELDNLIQTIDTNNSFKILTINDNTSAQHASKPEDHNKSESSVSSSISDNTINSCKTLLLEISSRLMQIFIKYNDELNIHMDRFEKQQLKHLEMKNQSICFNNVNFESRQNLLIYQRAILVEKLSHKHYDLLNILYKNMFDIFHQLNYGNSDQTCEDRSEIIEKMNETVEENIDSKNASFNNNSELSKNVLINKFHKINKILFDLELFDHLCGNVMVEVVENKIREHIENTSLDNYQETFIKSFENWLETIIIGWIKQIYSSNKLISVNLLEQSVTKQFTTTQADSKFEQYLVSYKKQLAHFMYTYYAHVRIKRLFDIVIDFPDSKNAIEDLKICLSKTNLRSHLIKCLKSSIEARLLHPGVNTSDIITAYVSAIKALLCLDSSGVMMENICEPLKKYLRNRDDTVKCIVSNLTDDADSSNDLMEEFCKDLYTYEGNYDMIDSNTAEPLGSGSSNNVDPTIDKQFDKNKGLKPWQLWMPDPIDAVHTDNSNSGSKSNIISMLVNIYGSKDMFVNEYKSLLADRLLANYSFNMEKEIRNLELLKLRFGEGNLFACEAMLKDISESKRINTNILEQLKQKGIGKIESFDISPSTLKCIILSEQFWPKLKEEKIEMPHELSLIQERFMQSYEAFKGNRTLIWKNNLGQVSIDIEIGKQKFEFHVTPIQAAIIMKFQEKDTWSLLELSQSLKMCSFALRKKLVFWKMQGLIKECEQNSQSEANNEQKIESSNTANEIYTLIKETTKLNKAKMFIEDEEESEKAAKSNDILKDQDLNLYWNYTQSMLRGCGCLPLERIHTWLKLYANPDLTTEQVKYLLDLKVKEQVLKYNAGLYRLNR